MPLFVPLEILSESCLAQICAKPGHYLNHEKFIFCLVKLEREYDAFISAFTEFAKWGPFQALRSSQETSLKFLKPPDNYFRMGCFLNGFRKYWALTFSWGCCFQYATPLTGGIDRHTELFKIK